MHITFATTASGAPMGQQVYEEEVIRRAPGVLGADAVVRRSIVRTLRSPLPGTARLPSWLLLRAPSPVRRAVGAGMYPGADVVHRMGLGLPPARIPEVVTVHDTVSWRFPDESAPEPFAAAELRRAAAVVAPSQFSADDVAEFFGLDTVHAIHNGVDARFFDAAPLPSARLAELGISGPYVLHAGGASERKNLGVLAEAWPLIASARPDLTLVMSGPPHERRTALFGHLERTRLVSRVPAADIAGLVAAASAVVVPSTYEGFGLPALEAMAAGVPVVAARASSLPEVVGDGGTLVEPTAAAIAEGVLFAAGDDTAVRAAVARGRARASAFTWERSAEQHAEVWRRVAGKI